MAPPVSSVPRQRLGVLMVVSGPSGSGKTTHCRQLCDAGEAIFSISCTTRSPRPGEKDGREYHFVTQERFDALIAEDAFFEWAHVHDNRYGTLKAPVYHSLELGDDVLFDIDWQGARQITERSSEAVNSLSRPAPTMISGIS